LATSSYSINNESVTEIPGRQDRESDDFGPELEGTTMDLAVEQFIYKEGNNRGSRENALNWSLHEEEGIMFATGGYGITFNRNEVSFKTSESGIQTHQRNCIIMYRVIQMLKNLGENLYHQRDYCLYVALLGLRDNSYSTIRHLKRFYACSTWKGKLYEWNHFVDFLTEEEGRFQYFDTPKGLEILIINFLEWCVWENSTNTKEVGEIILMEGLILDGESNLSIIPEKDRNCPESVVLLIKSAVCNLIYLAFNFDVGKLPVIQQWIKSWKKTNIVKRERYIETWDAGLPLDYLRTVRIDLSEEILFDEDYKVLLEKTIALVAFFTILRPNELMNLNKQSIIQDKDDTLLCTKN
jgi:hypothetical protein